MESCFYEIDEILNEAIITGVPALIVEGIDDISVYDNLSPDVEFNYEVYSIDNIDGFGEGCDQVIRAIEELNSLNCETHRLDDHILAIIDKDVRDFRLELPELEPILVLNYYSIESHFVAKEIVQRILSICCKANRDLITDELCKKIMDEVSNKLLDLYYFSLEALKKALEPEYESCFSYSYNYGRTKDPKIRQELENKKEALDLFANENDLTNSLETLKRITKGKWLLDLFAIELLKAINDLQSKCHDNEISNCKPCKTGAYDKCLYRINDGYTNKSLKSLALSQPYFEDLTYIVDRIRQIKKSCLHS